MANLTQYLAGVADNEGTSIASWVGTTIQYNAIKRVSDINDSVNYNPNSSDFDPNFAHTIYYTY